MSVSHVSVHPVEDLPPAAAATQVDNQPHVRRPATLLSLTLRFFQFFFAADALCIITTTDFPSVTAFLLAIK